MSFFNSLQQYVTSGVAGLGLSPRRFSLSRQESTEPSQPQPSTDKKETTSTQVHHGFPKVIPAPGTVTPPQSQGSIRRQSRALECLAPPRKGSLRQRHSPVHQPTPPDRPPLVFCKRRLSRPDVDPTSTSGVQETDGSYFESFTALSWKRDNRRFSAVRVSETRAETLLESEREQPTEDDIERPDEKEQLYVDVLYTITNTVGAPPAQPGGQFAHYKEEMYLQVQRAFGVAPDRHYRLLNAATEDKPKIVVLTVLVQEAEGIEAKDANGDADFVPKWNELDGKINRVSHCGEYKIEQNYPLNPSGRTGIIGRGLLGRWGPNHAADPIVTRWKRDGFGKVLIDDNSGLKILQMVAIKRIDTKEWAIPGGMVDAGEKVSETVRREFMEEALSSTANLSSSLTEFFDKGTEVYSGYVDDPRNTDNAWMETVAYNFHDDSGAIVGDIKLCAGDDAGKLKWMDLNRSVDLYASHKDIVEIVVERLKAFW